MGYGLWAMGYGPLGGRWRATSRGSGRGSSPSRPCCGGGLGSATRRRCARHRGPLRGRPARQPLASARGGVRHGAVPHSTERRGHRKARDGIPSPGVTTSRGGRGVARAHHGRVGLIAGWGVGNGAVRLPGHPRTAPSAVRFTEPREGRGSAERLSVAGAPTESGAPMPAATEKPRRGSHVPTGAVAHTAPADSTDEGP